MSYKNSFFYSDENEEEFPPGRHANILKQWLKQNIKNSKKYKDDFNSYWKQSGWPIGLGRYTTMMFTGYKEVRIQHRAFPFFYNFWNFAQTLRPNISF